jgi:hypothetical protein
MRKTISSHHTHTINGNMRKVILLMHVSLDGFVLVLFTNRMTKVLVNL